MKRKELYSIIVLIVLGIYSWIHEIHHFGKVSPLYTNLDGINVDLPIFTSHELSGYIHFMNPNIKTFVDTFWEPHTNEVIDKYKYYMVYPDMIPKEIKSCVISIQSTMPFINSKKWRLVEKRDFIAVFKRK